MVLPGGEERADGLRRAAEVHIEGRILYLTADPELLRRQLEGETLSWDPERPLLDNISTDEITPAWACYYYDATLARYCLVGLRGGAVGVDAIRNGGFEVVVSGRSKGCGSSRETAPYAELASGIRLVIAASVEKIYAQNAQNIGLLVSTDLGLIARIEQGEPLPMEAFTRGLDAISSDVVCAGGLFAYNRARMAGRVVAPEVARAPRAMTMAEKIVAAHAVVDAKEDRVGTPAIAAGDALFARADVRFSHEYVTPMAEALFALGFGAEARVESPESVFAFRDHLTLLDSVMPAAHVKMGLREQAQSLATVQERFAHRNGIKLYGEVVREGRPAGSEGICHNLIIEEVALPGQLVIGTDSHTCMAGALGCLAFGVGATDMANAWLTADVRMRVPESIRFDLRGKLGDGVCAKDVMLFLLAQPYWRTGQGIGKVLEFTGEGIKSLSLDERATLTNMAVEAGGFTGIIEADEEVVAYLARQRGLDPRALRERIVRSDAGATYADTFEVDLGAIEPMVALPGDPRNGVPLRELSGSSGGGVRIDVAYGGSCTGGKKSDMDMYASVLAAAAARGQRISPHVRLFLQFGSQQIRRYAESRGYLEIFRAVGAELIEPSCGACIRAGPGVSLSPEEVTVSAINRNFPGRSGPGKVYLASPQVVAASALAGEIVHPASLAAGAGESPPFCG
jgi:3-isopropylmalate/(R)-2-methylmalate dehydratase large subunit